MQHLDILILKKLLFHGTYLYLKVICCLCEIQIWLGVMYLYLLNLATLDWQERTEIQLGVCYGINRLLRTGNLVLQANLLWTSENPWQSTVENTGLVLKSSWSLYLAACLWTTDIKITSISDFSEPDISPYLRL